MNINELKEYLLFAEDHYSDLAKLMKKEKKDNYYYEHKGKVKFIRLLKLKLEKNS